MSKGNSRLLLLLVIGCIYCNSTNVYAYSIDNNYNPDSAAYYAKMWATGFNTQGYYDAGLDCTNIV